MVAALGRMLRENGFVIPEAFDGETALELLRKNKPSLIFLDIVLPGISGFDVLRRVRRSQYVGLVPVIVMSGKRSRNRGVLRQTHRRRRLHAQTLLAGGGVLPRRTVAQSRTQGAR